MNLVSELAPLHHDEGAELRASLKKKYGFFGMKETDSLVGGAS